ncbi:lytic transglycosylase domain-containing protein [Chelativorans sp.]|uniref:lytic transglycosylase domain-containing protein n=1 Tax=Chelativorans sp. TaxID=2203393 RepID=UPI002810B3B5|nr:lytic transglycosylase domain-containing protein [Chelativorans sp.]
MRSLLPCVHFHANPLIDRAPIKPSDPIAFPAAAKRSEGQGRPDGSHPCNESVAEHACGNPSSRRSLALEGSEHGRTLAVHRDGGQRTIGRSGVGLAACLVVSFLAAFAHASDKHPSKPATAQATTFWSEFVAEAAARFAIPEHWIEAVIRVESGGNARAVSPKGAMGLMQIMPATWHKLRMRHALGDDPFLPRDNILAGAAYVREMLDRFGREGFLAAYNAGPARYQQHRATGRPLPAETMAYVEKLSPLVDAAAHFLSVAEQPMNRADALRSPMFPQHRGSDKDGRSQEMSTRKTRPQSLFASVRSLAATPTYTAPVSDVTAFTPAMNMLPHRSGTAENSAFSGLFVQRSSDPSQ